nr:hypothetical protein [Tanacetum cinerariifolium]
MFGIYNKFVCKWDLKDDVDDDKKNGAGEWVAVEATSTGGSMVGTGDDLWWVWRWRLGIRMRIVVMMSGEGDGLSCSSECSSRGRGKSEMGCLVMDFAEDKGVWRNKVAGPLSDKGGAPLNTLVDKKGGSYAAIAPKLEPGKFNKWEKRMLCYLARMELYYLKCIKDGPFQPKTAEGDAKHESQWTPDERRVVVQDQRLKSIIMSCLPDDIMESVISCVSAKETWTDLVYSFEGPLYTKENRIIDLKLEYQTFRAKSTESLSQTYTHYKTLLNELSNDGVNLSKHEINVGFMNSLPEKWLTFSQGLRNANHTQTLDLAYIYERFVYEDNLIQRRYSYTKEALVTTPSSSVISTVFFSNNVIQDFQENSNDEVDERSMNNSSSVSKGFQTKFTPKLIQSSPNSKSQTNLKFQKDYKAEYKNMKAKLALLEASPSSPQNPKTFQPKNKGLVAEIFDWNEEEVSEDEEVTQVKYASTSKKVLKAKAKPFPTYKHCGFNDHRLDDYKNYLKCEICGSYDHFTSEHNRIIHIRGGVLVESSQSNESQLGLDLLSTSSSEFSWKSWITLLEKKAIEIAELEGVVMRAFWCQNTFFGLGCPHRQTFHRYLQGQGSVYDWHSSVSERRSMILFSLVSEGPSKDKLTSRDKSLDLSAFKLSRIFFSLLSSGTLVVGDRTGFTCEKRKHHRASFKTKQNFSIRKSLHLLHMDLFGPVSPMSINHKKYTLVIVDEYSRERIPDISYYHVFGCPVFIHNHKDHLENHVPEVIVPNKYDVPLTEDIEDPPDLINTEGTREQNVQDFQIITQPTDVPSGNNTEVSRPITEPLVPNVTQSHIPNQASTSSHLAPQDRWSRDQHIKLVNIIGNPGEGMLTRSMDAKLTTASASECLFADFPSEIEPKNLSEDDKGILIYQEQYTMNLLKKYDISDSSLVKTPMVPPNNLGPDLAGKPVNETSYRGMIMSLALISKDIQTQTMLAVTWTKKSTSGAYQILGGKLICWSAKKQKSVVMSSAEAEYVAAAGCCAMTPSPLVAKPKKGKSQTITSTLPKSQNPKASGALSKKSKRPTSKKPPTEIKVTPSKPMEGSEQSHSVSSGLILDPQDLKRYIQLASTGLPSTLDEGTRNSKPLLEGTAKTTSCPKGSRGDKDSWGNKPPADMEPQNPTDADLSGTGAKDKTDKLVKASMSSLENSSTTINDLYKGLEVVTQILKDITNYVKDDPATNKKYKEASKTLTKISTQTTEMFSSVRSFDFFTIQSTVKNIQDHAVKQEEASTEDTSSIKSMMTEMYNAFRGQSSSAPSSSVTLTFSIIDTPANVERENTTHTVTKKPPSHTKGEIDANIQEKPKELKQSTDANIEFIGSSTHPPSKA